MSVFGTFLVRILPHLDWIQRDTLHPYSVQMRENTDQKTSKHGYFSRSDYFKDTIDPIFCCSLESEITFNCHSIVWECRLNYVLSISWQCFITVLKNGIRHTLFNSFISYEPEKPKKIYLLWAFLNFFQSYLWKKKPCVASIIRMWLN